MARKPSKSDRWWLASKENLAAAVETTVKSIDKSQKRLQDQYARLLSLYESKKIDSLDGIGWADPPSIMDEDEFKENIIRQVIDAATAKISTSRPRARFMTKGADQKLQKRAERRTKFIDGVFKHQKTYQIGRDVFKDGGIYGTSLVKSYPDFDKKCIVHERVLASEILVDYMDGKYRKPRSMFQIKTVARSVAMANWPKRKEAIVDAGLVRNAKAFSESIDDPITLIEGWHLPSGKDAKDGRRVVCTTSGWLEDEKWQRHRFPLAVWRWKCRSFGWHGMGVGEDIEPQQKELDFINEKIQRILNKMTVRVWLEKMSGVDENDITNDDMPIGEYVGNAPIFNPDPGPPEALFMERERIIQSAFNQVGLSQLTAQSQLPKGLTAAVAQQEYKDTESQRFMDVGQAWDEFFMEIAEITLDSAEELAERFPNEEVGVTIDDGMEIIRWGDFSHDTRSDMKMEPWPAALFPLEPHGRLARINEMIGMFPEAAPLLISKLDHPDVESVTSILNAPVDAILHDIDKLNEGEFVSPEPFLKLKLAEMLVLASYQKTRSMENTPKNAEEAHRQYLLSLRNLIEQQEAEMMQKMAMAGGGPPGMPPGPGMPPAGVPS